MIIKTISGGAAFVFVLCGMFVACRSGTERENTKVPIRDTLWRATADKQSEITTVAERMVIYLWPDSVRLEQMKQKLGEEDFYTVMDDESYYMSTASMFLDSITKTDGIKTYKWDENKKPRLKFILKNGQSKIVAPDTLFKGITIWFFDPAKGLRDAEMTMIAEDYAFFFKNNPAGFGAVSTEEQYIIR